MSEFFLCEIENIEKSGVEIKVTGTRFKKDDDDDCIRTVRTVCFDFTKHDKVFEDKIAKLEKEVAEWKAEAREIKKNRDEQLKSFRKAVEPYVDILHMHETIAELKQHIAELESKETEKPTKYTTVIVAKEINGQTYVTLDDFMSVVNDLQAEIGT